MSSVEMFNRRVYHAPGLTSTCLDSALHTYTDYLSLHAIHIESHAERRRQKRKRKKTTKSSRGHLWYSDSIDICGAAVLFVCDHVGLKAMISCVTDEWGSWEELTCKLSL